MLRPNLKFEHCMNTLPLFCMPNIKSNAKLNFIIEKKNCLITKKLTDIQKQLKLYKECVIIP